MNLWEELVVESTLSNKSWWDIAIISWMIYKNKSQADMFTPKIRQRLGHTAAHAKIITHKSSRTALHTFYFINIIFMMCVPCPRETETHKKHLYVLWSILSNNWPYLNRRFGGNGFNRQFCWYEESYVTWFQLAKVCNLAWHSIIDCHSGIVNIAQILLYLSKDYIYSMQ